MLEVKEIWKTTGLKSAKLRNPPNYENLHIPIFITEKQTGSRKSGPLLKIYWVYPVLWKDL